jgi:hypothetical protein
VLSILLSKLPIMSQGQNLCPFYQSHVRSTYLESAHNFLTKLPTSEQSIHKDCTKTQCRGRIAGMSNEPKHCSGCSNNSECTLIAASIEDVKSCINNDSIPLLRFRYTSQGQLNIKVVRATFDSRYIAVSHVWTGGLGNPHSNALYQCQLREVAASGRQIRRIVESGRDPSFPNLYRQLYRKLALGDIDLFWIDTLCIPVREIEGNVELDIESAASKSMRGKAIDRMTQIYAGAHSVLVMDPEIRSLDNEILNTNPDEFYGRMIRSDWMRRCWTYQEGAMASRLFALLRSGPVYLTQHRFQILHDDRGRYSALRKELTKWISDLPGPRQTRDFAARDLIIGGYRDIFSQVWNALVSRLTSREADRYLILSLMLGLVPSPLLDIRDDLCQQSRTIFNSLDRVPLDFLYNKSGFGHSFWLPTQIKQQSFSCGYIMRLDRDQPLLTLTAESAMAGLVPRGLYFFEHMDMARDTLVLSTKNGPFLARLELSKRTQRLLRGCHQLALLVQNTEDDVYLETDVALFQYWPKNDVEGTWGFKWLCATTCELSRYARRGQPSVVAPNEFITHPEYSYDISCGKHPS